MAKRSLSIHLSVLLNGERVGTLVRGSSGRLSFEYTPAWIAGKSLPISLSMPIKDAPYTGAIVSSFFGNLLPDNEVILERLAQKFQANSTDPVELLSLMGRDCVGALQFIPKDEEIPKAEGLKFKTLDEEEIHRILSNLSISPLGMNESDEFRISIAGAQEKTALLYLNNRWCRPLGVTPSTHILKPRLGILPNRIDMTMSAENEWVCLQIAKHFGFEVPQSQVLDFKDIRCLVVERFDRKWIGSRLTRLPQEDLCQALGIPYTKKYENRGGVGIKQIMDFLNSSDYRDRDRATFFKAQILFYLLAGTDGHAKNFSVFPSKSGFRLTPLYDILSLHPALQARQIEKKEAKLAMGVGSPRHYRLSEIQNRHWYESAKASDVSKEAFEEMLQEVSEKAKSLEKSFQSYPSAVSGDLIGVIISGLRSSLRSLD
ncbi:MAG: type II toxin-antitoxin system HipA family toxin [Bradymonadales bacterium]|nr:MAG: type II toxin-antitoxin system HipA family toxin [Bradymonadales bacterium]